MKKCLMLVVTIVVALFSIGCNGVEDKLEKQLKSSDASIRREAAVQLGDVATPRALQLLEMDQDDPDFRVREAVRAAIALINKRTFMK